MAIRDFWSSELRLPGSLETDSIKGKTYAELDQEDQQRFLDFAISLDLFVAATQEDVVEVFRRMNSYTVPLNPEEQRHASHQGAFKWFVARICKKFGKAFVDIGIFGEKQLVRMADTKLISEVCDAMLFGIRTTNKKILDRLYDDRDRAFAEEQDFQNRLTEALDELRAWDSVHKTNIVKPYIVYSLLLAMIHARHPVRGLGQAAACPRIARFNQRLATDNLLAISTALDDPDNNQEFSDFIEACTEKTNT